MKNTALFLLLFILPLTINSYSYNLVADQGWNIADSKTSDWKIKSGTGTLSITANSIQASIAADSTAEWVITAEPIWIYRFSEAVIRYRAQNLINDQRNPVIQIKNASIGPVTPGAMNLENPLARAGTVRMLFDNNLICDGKIHEITAIVYPAIRTEQIDQITLCLKSGQNPASFVIEELSFQRPAAEQKKNLFSTASIVADEDPAKSFLYKFLPITDCGLSINTVAENHIHEITQVSCSGIPFQWNPQTMMYTNFRSYGKISIPVHAKGSQVFLLMGMNLAGTDIEFSFSPRSSITQPERLMVTKQYEDGSIEKSFPYHVGNKAYIAETTMSAYMIPVDPAKTLSAITIEEYMSYCQVFLSAVTLYQFTVPLIPINEPVYPKTLPYSNGSDNHTPFTITKPNPDRFLIEDDCVQMELSLQSGLQLHSLIYKPVKQNIISTPAQMFVIQGGNQKLFSSQCQIESVTSSGNSLSLVLKSENKNLPLKVYHHFIFEPSAQIRMTLAVENVGDATIPLQVSFPCLSAMRLSKNPEDDFYFFPTKQAVWNNQPVRVKAMHSGEFPLQFMDLYSETGNFGIALHARETRILPEEFTFEKGNAGSGMRINYGIDNPIELQPGHTFSTPECLIQIHPGDWRIPFQEYKQWANAVFTPQTNARDVLKNVFLCRRDYPLGGTGYLFDISNGQYTMKNLIAECQEDLGGVDMLDISGWAYSERHGRVGQYEKFELGGADNLQANIGSSHQARIPVGLYFEGYLIDPRSDVGQQYVKEWQVINPDGTPKQWPGNQELFMCPASKNWQDWMSKTIYQVAAKTNADAVYLDQYGFADKDKTCYSTAHGHEKGAFPLAGEHQMIQRVRESLNQTNHPVAIYMEQAPNDITAPFADAAFDYSMSAAKTRLNPTKMNVFRYAFPSFKIIELFHGGIDPKGISEEDVKLCFFHGHGFWLKGRARSWYSGKCREFIAKAYRIFHEHSEIFTSELVEPQIPTAQRGIYANRFTGNNEKIVMVYNAANKSKDGLLLTLEGDSDSATDLWGIPGFHYEKTAEEIHIYGFLEPHGIACFSLKL